MFQRCLTWNSTDFHFKFFYSFVVKAPVSEELLDPSVSESLIGCDVELTTFVIVSGAVVDDGLKTVLVSCSNLGADGFCLRAGFQKLQ